MDIRIKPDKAAGVSEATTAQVDAVRSAIGEITQALGALASACGSAPGGVSVQLARLRQEHSDAAKAACGLALGMVAALDQGVKDFMAFDADAAEQFETMRRRMTTPQGDVPLAPAPPRSLE